MNNIKLFIINLKKDKLKRKNIEYLCIKYKLNYEFIDAVDGRLLDDDFIEKVYSKSGSIEEMSREMTRSEVGCALSHISIYKIALERNIEYCIILEDDSEFDERLNEIIQNVKKIPTDFDLLLLGYYTNSVSENKTHSSFWYKKSLTCNQSIVRLIEPTYGAHGYIISLSGAKKLLNNVKKILLPIDLYTGNSKYINLYALEDPIILLNQFLKKQSNISKEREEMNQLYGLSSIRGESNSSRMMVVKILTFFKLFRILKLLAFNVVLFYKKIKPIKRYSEETTI
jgi:glycosyl transferase, family 25